MEDELIDQTHRDFVAREKYLSRAPGDAATKAYIASKYLSSNDDKKKKKKKKTKASQHGNLGIVDEDEWGWHQDDAPKAASKREKSAMKVSAGRPSTWQSLQGSRTADDDDDDEDSRPVFVPTDASEIPQQGPRMSSGQRAGLLTSKEIRDEADRARHLEERAMRKVQGQQEQETVHRDSSGRRIDPKLLKAEEKRQRQLEIEKKEREMEWGKGLVQREEKERLKRQLEEEKFKPLARYVDDADYNQELKDEERWNDPGAAFITRKKQTSGSRTKQVRPSYKGPWKPNRFMIPPGYRWDGVDRSTGYEDKFLLHQNQQKSFQAEAHAWSTEDM
ncbi:hypothetical protein DM01DRAFT_1333267 [Hesseltinella vesiculosa]|uniref:Pre-mRNA-splicing factor CWC26 n=1 Tax=Hesseltinella vesiculosa TaxID=101127 RepID=A0A1X2GRN7_9FUNG|nr:hypothetical protein DM01DRAFT_1333267 [Hesseltinella vesiculosa]